MAFLEEFGKKVSQTSQDAIKKTKSVAESAKINSQISAENKIVWDNITKLGERYYELFRDEPDEKLSEIVDAIKNAQLKISEYELQLLKLKGIERCPSCGAQVNDSAAFCVSCGTKLPEPVPVESAPPAEKFCKNCGKELDDDVAFCSGCGARVE